MSGIVSLVAMLMSEMTDEGSVAERRRISRSILRGDAALVL